MGIWGIPELGPGMGEALVWLLTTSVFPEASSCREVSGMRDAAAVPVQNKDGGDTPSWVASDSEPPLSDAGWPLSWLQGRGAVPSCTEPSSPVL